MAQKPIKSMLKPKPKPATHGPEQNQPTKPPTTIAEEGTRPKPKLQPTKKQTTVKLMMKTKPTQIPDGKPTRTETNNQPNNPKPPVPHENEKPNLKSENQKPENVNMKPDCDKNKKPLKPLAPIVPETTKT